MAKLTHMPGHAAWRAKETAKTVFALAIAGAAIYVVVTHLGSDDKKEDEKK